MVFLQNSRNPSFCSLGKIQLQLMEDHQTFRLQQMANSLACPCKIQQAPLLSLTNCCSYYLSFGPQEHHFGCLTHRLGMVIKFVHTSLLQQLSGRSLQIFEWGPSIHPSKARKDGSHITSNTRKHTRNREAKITNWQGARGVHGARITARSGPRAPKIPSF
uniref:Uncharacterized protein n=1 Tax=Arundo donax TaxID=35708 RepID=A0A0A9EXK9_ARUDO